MRKYIYGHHILSATKILRFMAFRLQLESIHFKNSDLNNKTIVSDRFSYKTKCKIIKRLFVFFIHFLQHRTTTNLSTSDYESLDSVSPCALLNSFLEKSQQTFYSAPIV